ncbi:FUSC family protein [Tengunoibacter tsumagoiensis]|uniref:Integral membrane bound transporter domain-containing protein n=1 Tax=Tengunoibacter tsumagoiensis TaxID=2014871 RepID=A0A402AAA4_9CHLR|nr:FUSC family protein [Tengunoibacter tsumagoiensis]GCE16097.1 hypothetical protein KTT_59560 [Tengunoibacter tsumagoiensis]
MSQSEKSQSPWYATPGYLFREIFKFQRSQQTAIPAIRSAIGFAIPLIVGVYFGNLTVGVSLAGGAATLGTVGIASPYRTRIRTLLLACLGIACSAFIGSITGPIPWLSVIVTGVWGIGAGLLVALGTPAMLIGLQSMVALIILSHYTLDPFHAFLQASLMLAGALFQTAMVLIPLPRQQSMIERNVLATTYQSLAKFASGPSDPQLNTALSTAFIKAQTTLAEINTQSQQGTIFVRLLNEAERIRLSLFVLKRWQKQIETEDALQSAIIDEILQSTAIQLEKITHQLKLDPRDLLYPPLFTNKRKNKERPSQQTLPQIKIKQPVIEMNETLRRQLHVARKLATSWKHRRHSQSTIDLVKTVIPPQQSTLSFWSVLRANLTLRSVFFRHAIRLGITLTLATALYKFFPHLLFNGYWIPLTALFILKPDFNATLSSSIARMIGTILGAVLTTVIITLLAPSVPQLVLLNILMLYLAFSLFYVNYVVFSVFLTVETVLLLDLVTRQPLFTAVIRTATTTIGGLLALAIYTIWPTWERSRVANRVADYVEALRQYCVAILETYGSNQENAEAKIYKLQLESRLARSNAELSVNRTVHEPVSQQTDPELTQGILSASESIAKSTLILHGYKLHRTSDVVIPEFTDFAHRIDEALHQLANATRTGAACTPGPDIHESLQRLKQMKKIYPFKSYNDQILFGMVLSEVQNITQTIQSMQNLVKIE